MERLPEIVQRLALLSRIPPTVIAFTFQPLTGQVLSIGNSPMPMTPEAFSQAANAASTVSQMLVKKSLEVGNALIDSEKERVDGVQGPCEDPEPRDGVGEEDSVASPINDSGELPFGGKSGDSRVA